MRFALRFALPGGVGGGGGFFVTSPEDDRSFLSFFSDLDAFSFFSFFAFFSDAMVDVGASRAKEVCSATGGGRQRRPTFRDHLGSGERAPKLVRAFWRRTCHCNVG